MNPIKKKYRNVARYPDGRIGLKSSLSGPWYYVCPDCGEEGVGHNTRKQAKDDYWIHINGWCLKNLPGPGLG